MKSSISTLLLLILLVLSSCNKQKSKNFCSGASANDYSPSFIVSIPDLIDYKIPLKYTCANPDGSGISPPISWEGVPDKATRLEILVIDATCTYMCDPCCKYTHWKLDIPLNDPSCPFKKNIPEGMSNNPTLKNLTLENTSRQKKYMNFCPPKIQTHAIIVCCTAYNIEKGKKIIYGRSQSHPYLVNINS